MSQLVSFPRRMISHLKLWMAGSLGLVLLLAMLVLASGQAEASARTTNSWATVAPMPTARTGLAASLGSDGRIYAIGGCCDSNFNPVNTVEAYSSSTNSWATVAPMPTARASLAASLGSDGRIYAIGGRDSYIYGTGLFNTVEAYTP